MHRSGLRKHSHTIHLAARMNARPHDTNSGSHVALSSHHCKTKVMCQLLHHVALKIRQFHLIICLTTFPTYISTATARIPAGKISAGKLTSGTRSIFCSAVHPISRRVFRGAARPAESRTISCRAVLPGEYRDTCTPRHVAARLPSSSTVSTPLKRSMRARHVARAKK